ncbi:MAG TPA: VOC family protein [Terriglobales bacterium]|nr:VOC family protein [Terriglobales bacterium]
MPRITPHLWFEKEAKEAAGFYTSIFKDSKIKSMATLADTPSGTVDLATIELSGLEFSLLSAGPLFKFTPAVSFLVRCDTKDEVDALWSELSQKGSVLVDLGEYPFSERYGWTEDRYGLSWQVMFSKERANGPRITPSLLFVGNQCGKAGEAINFYASVFHDTRVGPILRYGRGEEPNQEGTIKHATFVLEGETFAAMDSARAQNFTFNEAISFMVPCSTQEEIDYYWTKLSADRSAEQCGWLKDKYGLSWQIVPTVMEEMLMDKDKAKVARVTEAFLKMKKFDIATLNEAYGQGRSAA